MSKEMLKKGMAGEEMEKEDATVVMPLDEFIEEHKKLIKVLREGSREELLSEAKEQEEELEKYCSEEE
jgi:nucleoside-triphosphatase THEP1